MNLVLCEVLTFLDSLSLMVRREMHIVSYFVIARLVHTALFLRMSKLGLTAQIYSVGE